ncbi:OmpA family protein [Yoonia sp. 2307UL14-13]|uniref:OmpA family protein n=1 Tax=Yoonia sp. 2307UL14-13 TaxID=3126506 RepID=UPI0030955B1F
MEKKHLKSTTSLVMSLALVANPLWAQETTEATDIAACAGLTEEGVFGDIIDPEALDATFPCRGPDDLIIADQDALNAAITAQVETDAGEVVEQATDEVAEGAEVVEEQVTEGAESLTEATDDAAATVEENLAATPEEVAPDTEEAVTADAEVEAEADASTQEVATSDVDSEVASEADINAEASADNEEAAETEAAEGATDPALPEGDDAAQIADTPVVNENATDTQTDLATEETVTPEADAEVAVDVDTDADAEAEAEAATDETATANDETDVAAQEAEPEVPPAAADVDIDALADAEAETVTEEDVRTSNQDFDTDVTGQQAAEAVTDDDDDEGLTDFQQALLLGLGAVVVGSVLDNGDEVVSNSGDRVVVERNGDLVVLKDDDVLLRQPGSQVQTQTFDDGSTLTVVTRADNTRIVTIRGADGRVMQRKRVFEDGSQVILFDDTQAAEPVDVATLPERPSAPSVSMSDDVDTLRQVLLANQNARFDRSYSLRQVRTIREVRELAPEVELDTVTFATGSAAIDPSQAEELVDLGNTISDIIAEDPGQVFLIEGHTDAVGDAGYNLALSDRRAETVALALTEYFRVPPENLITQGYGESNLKVATLEAERQNRRAAVRNITPLLQ